MARAGRASAEAGVVAADEPLSEWETELLGATDAAAVVADDAVVEVVAVEAPTTEPAAPADADQS
jgi:hypothetical protein